MMAVDKNPKIAVIGTSSSPELLTKHLSLITRCPQGGCNGALRFSALPGKPGRGCGGYVGDATAVFRCQDCNLGFTITNPRSFLTLEGVAWLKKWMDSSPRERARMEGMSEEMIAKIDDRDDWR